MIRLFSTEKYKGTQNYLNSQKKYEIIRTILYFAISIFLFIAGYVATKTKVNIWTIIAVLGCLPASKSAVSMIMFLRYKSCPVSLVKQTEEMGGALEKIYDLVFTTYEKNYQVDCMVLKGNIICGYTSYEKCDSNACEKHINTILKQDGHNNYTVKIFKNKDKFMERLTKLNQSETEVNKSIPAIRQLLLEVSL